MPKEKIDSNYNSRDARGEKSSLSETLLDIVSFPGLGSFVFGLLAASLLLSTGTITAITGSRGFFFTMAALLVVTLLVRWQSGKEVDRGVRWGLGTLLILGFGIGLLLQQHKEWIKWLWSSYRRINEPWELIMEGLFLFGVDRKSVV